MNGEQHPGFGGHGPIIVSTGPGPGWFQPGPAHRPEREAKVPPRVEMAMKVMQMLTVKCSHILAREYDHHDGFTNARGQDLTEAEQIALSKAAQVVGEYAAGILKVSKTWDLPRELTDDERKGEGGIDSLEYVKVPCSFCNRGKVPQALKVLEQAQCDYCGGNGWMLLARVG